MLGQPVALLVKRREPQVPALVDAVADPGHEAMRETVEPPIVFVERGQHGIALYALVRIAELPAARPETTAENDAEACAIALVVGVGLFVVHYLFLDEGEFDAKKPDATKAPDAPPPEAGAQRTSA